MRFFTALAVVLLSFQAVSATSIHPCTPTVQAQPTHLTCIEPSGYYSIQIDTLMSRPLEMCQGKNHFEYHTATVLFQPKGATRPTQVVIYNSDLSYTLGNGGAPGAFVSPKFGLNLRNCISPMNGGFSIGN